MYMCRELEQDYREEACDAELVRDIEERIRHHEGIMIAEERSMRRSTTVNVDPTSLNDRRFLGLGHKLLKEKKADHLLIVCISYTLSER